jgi:hypothetical protein
MDIQQPMPAPRRTQKTTLVLEHAQIAFLDEVSASIRRRSDAVVDRSALIRALIEGLYSSQVDCSRAGSGPQLATAVASCLKRGMNQRDAEANIAGARRNGVGPTGNQRPVSTVRS